MSPERNYLARLDIAALNEQESTSETETELEVIVLEGEIETNSDPNPIGETLEVREKKGIGRSEGTPNIPDYLKRTIAVLANEPGIKQTDVAREFNVANSTVSNFSNGLDNSRRPDEELTNIVDEAKAKHAVAATADRTKIEDIALQKTMMALNLIGEDDLVMMGAKDKSIIAGNLSKVAANMRDKTVNNNTDNRVQLIINSPPVRKDLHYPVLEVG